MYRRHPADTTVDADDFSFTDDFFLASYYLPESRLCSILPEDRLSDMISQLNEQEEYHADRTAFPLVRNRHVDRYIRYYQYTAHHDFAASLEKSAAYVPYITALFEREGIPGELAYLALIESDFNVLAYSKNNAVGMWQFMRQTAQGCGLRVNQWIDERQDFEKSTRAAACYLKKLYAEFGSWHLVVAAYNAGEMSVRTAICKKGAKSFWAINNEQHFKCETVNFVPQLIAVITIAKNPRAFGFTTLRYEKPFVYDTVTVSQATDLKRIATDCGCSLKELKELNPALKRDHTPPGVPKFPVHIPRGTKEQFFLAQTDTPSPVPPVVAHHTVKKGETLYHIARRYGTTPQALLAANGMHHPKNIKAGEQLIVSRSREGIMKAERVQKLSAGDSSSTENAADTRAVYRVKPGDTLWRIARAYNLRPEHIQRWNNLTCSTLQPGAELKIFSQQRE
jgi:membrane-bound lytic murein transglycosylase D